MTSALPETLRLLGPQSTDPRGSPVTATPTGWDRCPPLPRGSQQPRHLPQAALGSHGGLQERSHALPGAWWRLRSAQTRGQGTRERRRGGEEAGSRTVLGWDSPRHSPKAQIQVRRGLCSQRLRRAGSWWATAPHGSGYHSFPRPCCEGPQAPSRDPQLELSAGGAPPRGSAPCP